VPGTFEIKAFCRQHLNLNICSYQPLTLFAEKPTKPPILCLLQKIFKKYDEIKEGVRAFFPPFFLS